MTDTAQPARLQAGATPKHYVDEAQMPEWGIADDGRRVRLVPDAELTEQFTLWSAGACQHEKQFTGKTINSVGAAVFKRYCAACGIATTQHLPHRTIANTNIEPIDPAKREKVVDGYARKRREDLNTLANAAANRQQPGRRSDYADYLDSPQWKALRSSVMERCGGLCEGCRKSDADDVHHLTYRNLGREFLFQLVGLCRDCHTRWHEDSGLSTTDTGSAA